MVGADMDTPEITLNAQIKPSTGPRAWYLERAMSYLLTTTQAAELAGVKPSGVHRLLARAGFGRSAGNRAGVGRISTTPHRSWRACRHGRAGGRRARSSPRPCPGKCVHHPLSPRAKRPPRNLFHNP